MKAKNKAKELLPLIKKDLKHFLLSEEGKVSKKNIIKIGMSLTALGSLLVPASQAGAHSSSFFNDPSRGGHSSSGAITPPSGTHTSSFFNNADRGGHSSHGAHGSHGSHSSHGSHGSHGSHSSHGSHGSHGAHGSHTSHGSHISWDV